MFLVQVLVLDSQGPAHQSQVVLYFDRVVALVAAHVPLAAVVEGGECVRSFLDCLFDEPGGHALPLVFPHLLAHGGGAVAAKTCVGAHIDERYARQLGQ